MELSEIGLRYNEGITKPSEVSGVLQFFGEDICTVDRTRNVGYHDSNIIFFFSYIVFLEVNMFSPFVCDSIGPVNTGLIIIVVSDQSTQA